MRRYLITCESGEEGEVGGCDLGCSGCGAGWGCGDGAGGG